jgi:ADP-ribose pyrophosphatase YjhB (NUDIX family)
MAEVYRRHKGILLGSGAIVLSPEGDRVLMVRHKDMEGDFWRSKWIFPGGLVERGERLAEAAAREVLEETGLHVRIGHPIPPHDRVERGEDGTVELHVVYHVHWAYSDDEALVPGDDVGEAEWFTADDLERRVDEIHVDTWRLIDLSGLIDNLHAGKGLPDCICMPEE